MPLIACRSGLLAALLAVSITILGGGGAAAQRFQYDYGGPPCREAGHWGVKQLADGGYIAVGETFSVHECCTCSDVYVVRTNADGTPLWTRAYDLDTHDSATDVIQARDGSFVICGVTSGTNQCANRRDAFLLKIRQATGAVISAKSYGTPTSDEIAWNLTEATIAPGGGTNIGDYIVVGSTTSRAGAGRDGLIFRTRADLSLIWDQRYGGADSRDDFLYGVTEAIVGTKDCPAGQVVAVGASNSAGARGYDVWMIRVQGTNGAPFAQAVWGTDSNDEGWAVIEIRNDNDHRGDLVITGFSRGRHLTGDREILMLETSCLPGVIVADRFAGDPDITIDDAGIDLAEDAFPHERGGHDVIVTGYTGMGDAILCTQQNAFLQRFTIGTMAPVGPAMAYGGDGNDWGWSVNNAAAAGANTSNGYIVCGFTQSASMIRNDPEQLYLIKTDIALESGCNQAAIEFDSEAPGRPAAGFGLEPASFLTATQHAVDSPAVDWRHRLCYEAPGGGP